jgi:hypothetical protein
MDHAEAMLDGGHHQVSTFSPPMPAVVARKLMASRSQQSSAKTTRTFSPLSQPISKPSEHPTAIALIHRNAAIMTPLDIADVAIEQQAVNLHHAVDPLVIGRL